MRLLKKPFFLLSIFLLGIAFLASCQSAVSSDEKYSTLKNIMNQTDPKEPKNSIDTAIFGAGCFWCVEAQFDILKGVKSVKSGYAGGTTVNPTYEEISTGKTGHAEVIRIEYDPNVISYEALLVAFFLSHDPTQLNRQGNDIGTQYRSSIFPINEQQQQAAIKYIEQLNEKNLFGKKVVTTIEPNQVFYPAENYHDNYLKNNPQNPYCQMVAKPKLEKFKEIFKDDLK